MGQALTSCLPCFSDTTKPDENSSYQPAYNKTKYCEEYLEWSLKKWPRDEKSLARSLPDLCVQNKHVEDQECLDWISIY